MKIGIDIGGSHIGVGIIDLDAKIIDKMEVDIKILKNEKMENLIILKIIDFINTLLERNNLSINKIEKIGIACPGEPKEGCLKNLVNLNIKSFPIVEKLRNELNLKNISIRNDAKCAGLAEKEYGSLKNVDDGVFLCIGTGIGGSCFFNGKMLIPKRNSGFEFGHMIIKKGGNVCNCGNRGCFESYCSMKRFKTNIAKILNINESDSKQILKELKENLNNKNKYDELNKIIDEYLDNLLVGFANITNIFEPEVIAIGGGFVYFKDILWKKLNYKFENTNLLFNKETRPELRIARFGNDSGIIGAVVDRN